MRLRWITEQRRKGIWVYYCVVCSLFSTTQEWQEFLKEQETQIAKPHDHDAMMMFLICFLLYILLIREIVDISVFTFQICSSLNMFK